MTPNIIMNILVVEDDPTVASRLTSFLTGLGWNVDFAASGKTAIRLCKSKRYDAVLLDVVMPDLSGAAMLQQIKNCCDAPVLLMSASEGHDLSGRFTDADDIVPDPVNYRDIVSRCQRLTASEALAITA